MRLPDVRIGAQPGAPHVRRFGFGLGLGLRRYGAAEGLFVRVKPILEFRIVQFRIVQFRIERFRIERFRIERFRLRKRQHAGRLTHRGAPAGPIAGSSRIGRFAPDSGSQ